MNMIRFAAASAAILLAAPALAASPAAAPAPAHHRAEAAWRWLDQAMAPTLDKKQRARLIWAAYNNAAGSLCNEVAVDDAKMGKELAALLPPEGDAKTTPEQRKALEASLMLHLGAATGIFAAENADKLPTFCADAVALRDAKEPNNNLFLPAGTGDEKPAEKPKK
jgi:hypothetical protein